MTGSQVSEIVGDMVHPTDLSDICYPYEPTRWMELTDDGHKQLLDKVFDPETHHSFS